MLRGVIAWCLAILFAAAGPAWSADPQLVSGTLQGADWRIGVPGSWNGGLVVFAHGYQGERPGPGDVETSPLEQHLALHDYAWAASGYRSTGYHPDWFMDDTLALVELFVRRYGRPRWTVIYGQSMGGHMAIASLELHPEVFQGAFLECGAIDGVGLIDWYYAYTAAAEFFSWMPLLETSGHAFDVLKRFVWPRLMGFPGHYGLLGRRFDSVVENLAGGDLPDRLQGMAERYVDDLVPRDMQGEGIYELARHADTRRFDYRIAPGLGVDGASLNRRIARIVPAPGARSRERNPVFADFTGDIRVPVMSIHGTGDFRVPFRLEQDYRRRTDRAGTSSLLVQRAARTWGHCRFDDRFRTNGFDDLVSWLDKGVVPAGDDVLGDVTKLGLRWQGH